MGQHFEYWCPCESPFLIVLDPYVVASDACYVDITWLTSETEWRDPLVSVNSDDLFGTNSDIGTGPETRHTAKI